MIVDIQELAGELKVSKSGIYQWVSQRKIPFVKVGRSVRFDTDDIKRWLEEKKVEPRQLK